MFSLICVGINDWVNNREASDLRRHRGHYDVNVMRQLLGDCMGMTYGMIKAGNCWRRFKSHVNNSVLNTHLCCRHRSICNIVLYRATYPQLKSLYLINAKIESYDIICKRIGWIGEQYIHTYWLLYGELSYRHHITVSVSFHCRDIHLLLQ